MYNCRWNRTRSRQLPNSMMLPTLPQTALWFRPPDTPCMTTHFYKIRDYN